jgi:hypothetical protein
MIRLGFGLVAEVAYVCGAVEYEDEYVVCFRDSLGDSLVARHPKVEVNDGCAGKDLRLETVQLECNDLNNNFILEFRA